LYIGNIQLTSTAISTTHRIPSAPMVSSFPTIVPVCPG